MSKFTDDGMRKCIDLCREAFRHSRQRLRLRRRGLHISKGGEFAVEWQGRWLTLVLVVDEGVAHLKALVAMRPRNLIMVGLDSYLGTMLNPTWHCLPSLAEQVSTFEMGMDAIGMPTLGVLVELHEDSVVSRPQDIAVAHTRDATFTDMERQNMSMADDTLARLARGFRLGRVRRYTMSDGRIAFERRNSWLTLSLQMRGDQVALDARAALQPDKVLVVDLIAYIRRKNPTRWRSGWGGAMYLEVINAAAPDISTVLGVLRDVNEFAADLSEAEQAQIWAELGHGSS